MIEKSDNIHFFGTKRQPEITSNPTIPELTQDEINAAKVILLSSTPEEINKDNDEHTKCYQRV